MTDQTQLIVVRGNSGSGKTSLARAIRAAYGRGVALVHQDVLRREILRERDRAGAAYVGLIDVTVRYALEHGFHVVLEGILGTGANGGMLAGLRRDYGGRSHFFYLDVSFEETLRRHQTKANAGEFGAAEMREWYCEGDVLPGGYDRVIAEESAETDSLRTILEASRLLAIPVPGQFEPCDAGGA